MSQEGTWVGIRILQIAITECQDNTYDLRRERIIMNIRTKYTWHCTSLHTHAILCHSTTNRCMVLFCSSKLLYPNLYVHRCRYTTIVSNQRRNDSFLLSTQFWNTTVPHFQSGTVYNIHVLHIITMMMIKLVEKQTSSGKGNKIRQLTHGKKLLQN